MSPKLVVALPVKELKDLDRIELLIKDVDLVELRLDYLSKFDVDILDSVSKYKEKLIITLRDKNEGGVNYIDPVFKAYFVRHMEREKFMYDIEARFALRYQVNVKDKIVSIHYFDNVPEFTEVKEIFDKFDEAYLRKIAVIAKRGYKELLMRVLDNYDNAVVMPMGVNGVERIAFSLLGSKLIYAHAGEETAKGQLHYKDVRRILNQLSTIMSSPST
ncbi:3-dehydroquinate dehydratase [Sulfolobus acidocaldarius SUSAZ]|nr:3-dehydroquinate dehydratase [Sulfolobus acidocaldarius SUSAZ]